MSKTEETAVFGGGCFWCFEAIYRRVKGVSEAVSGYAGGEGKTNYLKLHMAGSSHAEVVKVTFDPKVVAYEQLLDIFWAMHDPTTLNRQGYDVGPEYRSIILATSEAQLKTAEASVESVAKKLWDNPITTEIKMLGDFTEAEDYHQNFYDKPNDRPDYCQAIIDPKLLKFRQKFADLLKEEL